MKAVCECFIHVAEKIFQMAAFVNVHWSVQPRSIYDRLTPVPIKILMTRFRAEVRYALHFLKNASDLVRSIAVSD